MFPETLRATRASASVQGAPALVLTLPVVVERAPLRDTPFDHVRLENVFEADLYGEMLEQFPGDAAFHPLHHADALRSDGTSTRQRLYLYPENLWHLPQRQGRL